MTFSLKTWGNHGKLRPEFGMPKPHTLRVEGTTFAGLQDNEGVDRGICDAPSGNATGNVRRIRMQLTNAKGNVPPEEPIA